MNVNFDKIKIKKFLGSGNNGIVYLIKYKNIKYALKIQKILKEELKKNLDKAIGIVIMNQKVISGVGNYLRADILYLSKISPFRKVNKLNDEELREIFKNCKILTWGDYDYKKAKKLKIINKTTKLPCDYDRMFFVYYQDEDIHGNKVIKKELFEGSQKRFIYYVPEIQK